MTTIEMSEETVLLQPQEQVERIVGRVTGTQPGPTVIVTVAIHGNEPSGLIAARRVLSGFSGREDEVRGDLISYFA